MTTNDDLETEYERLAAGYNDVMMRLGDAYYFGEPMTAEEAQRLREQARVWSERLRAIRRVWDQRLPADNDLDEQAYQRTKDEVTDQ